jgi:hypothetical protein
MSEQFLGFFDAGLQLVLDCCPVLLGVLEGLHHFSKQLLVVLLFFGKLGEHTSDGFAILLLEFFQLLLLGDPQISYLCAFGLFHFCHIGFET